MKIFYRRHLALFCSIFAAASICGCFLALDFKLMAVNIAIVLLLLCCICAIVFKKQFKIILKTFFCIIFALLAIVFQIVRIDTPQQNLSPYFGQQTNVSGIITEVNTSENFISSYKVKILTVGDISTSTNAILEFDYAAELEEGTLIDGVFTVYEIDDYSENASYYLAKNITLYLHSAENYTVEYGHETLELRLSKLNKSISDIICQKIDGEAGALVSALMLGNKDLFKGNTILNFKRSGISHILAISGMHLSVLMFFFDFILKKLFLPKGARGFAVTIISLFFLALTGFSLSTVRAFVMSAIVYLAFLVQEESDLFTNLTFSLFLILSFSPLSIYDIGMWLSFLAVFGIFVAQIFIKQFSDTVYSQKKNASKKDKYARRLHNNRLSPVLNKIAVYLFSAIVITVFANIFICVPAWLFFNEISLISLPANLIVSPIVSLILYIAPIFIMCNAIPYLSDIVALILKYLSNLVLNIVNFMSSLKSVTVSLNYFFVGPIVVLLSVVLIILLVIKLKRKWLISIPPFIAAVAFFLLIAFDNNYYANIIQIDYVGGTESEMLLLRDANEYSIIDISSGGYAYANSAYLLSTENCSTEISSYVITHYHNYHTNSLKKLLNKAIIRKLFLPYPQNSDEYYIMTSLITVANNANIDVILFDPETDTCISANTAINLSERGYINRSTHPTFFFRIKAYDQSLLYSAESLAEHTDLNDRFKSELSSDNFIIFGAHGPKTQTEFEYSNLSAIQPILIANSEIEAHFKPPHTNIVSNVVYTRIILSKFETQYEKTDR